MEPEQYDKNHQVMFDDDSVLIFNHKTDSSIGAITSLTPNDEDEDYLQLFEEERFEPLTQE